VVKFPAGFRCEALRRDHARNAFESGHPTVDDWLRGRALQSQDKHLSVTQVLIAENGAIAGYYTVAIGQVEFNALPADIAKSLPRRALPIAILAWLGVDRGFQARGLGARLLAQALADCHRASRTFAFVAVVLDCVDEQAKAFYQRWDFREMPGDPMRLFLTAKALDALMA
jgi:GNAT superfamily N-acetyltransferase